MFDIDYIGINQLAYTFNKLVNSNSNAFTSQLIDMAAECLELMDRYQALHPSYIQMLSFLMSQNIDTSKYNDEWVGRLNSWLGDYTSQLKVYENQTNLKAENAGEFFERIRTIVISLTIQTKYQEALNYLNRYASVVEFSTQPKTKQQFHANRYVEYLFMKFIIHIFSLIWFPLDDNDYTIAAGMYVKEGDKLLYSTSSFKPLTKIYNVVISYQKKNSALFEENDDELRYHWLVKFLHLSLLFKQFEFVEFQKEFFDLFVSQKEPTKYLFADTLLIKRNLLVMYAIVLIFTKLFNTLTSINIENEQLIDSYYRDPSSIEYKFFSRVLKPLGKLDMFGVRKALSNSSFLSELIATLEYTLPVSTARFSNNSNFFIEHMKTTIDFKVFLLLITNSRSISRLQALKLMGYDLTSASDLELNEVSNQLVGIVSALGLGRVGINYLADKQLFINNGGISTADEVSRLQDEIDDVQNELKGESLTVLIANLVLSSLCNEE